MITRSVPLFTDGDAAGAVRVWRCGGPAVATVIVKACFTLAHDGPARPAAAQPVLTEDRTFGGHPMRSVERAAETALHLAQCDVLCTGHAHAPGGRPSMSVRLALFRDRTALLDRTVHVFGDRKSGGAPQSFERMPLVYERAFGGPGVEANPVGTATPNLLDPRDPQRPAAFGPISPFWPARKRLVAGSDSAALNAPVPALPETFPWSSCQAAPPEQQVPFLAGDEWLVLDGMHPQLPRLQTRLPGATAAARLLTAGGEAVVQLRADMLVVDADRGTCAVVWRGRAPLPDGDPALSPAAVVAGVELPGRPVRWDALFEKARAAMAQGAPASSAASPPRRAPEDVGESTLGLSDAQQAAQSLRVVAPFEVSAPASSGPKSLAATPWGGPGPVAQVAPAPASAGEATIAVGGPPSGDALPFQAPFSVPAPAVAAPFQASLSGPPPAAAPPVSGPTPFPPTSAAPPSLVAAPEPPPLAAATPPPPRRELGALEERLRAAGTPAEDIALLVAALQPPPRDQPP